MSTLADKWHNDREKRIAELTAERDALRARVDELQQAAIRCAKADIAQAEAAERAKESQIEVIQDGWRRRVAELESRVDELMGLLGRQRSVNIGRSVLFNQTDGWRIGWTSDTFPTFADGYEEIKRRTAEVREHQKGTT